MYANCPHERSPAGGRVLRFVCAATVHFAPGKPPFHRQMADIIKINAISSGHKRDASVREIHDTINYRNEQQSTASRVVSSRPLIH